MNARSLCNKTLIVKDFFVDYKVDLLGITETWLHVEGSEVTIGAVSYTHLTLPTIYSV